ncbi:hypothetical protein E1176_01375, partial [Fulvivirga sp. RKSG066]|uniref:hypothetical protein n=1 Tax=Fulvivirga aurantia TaxID=2529383 RepID=UPI0012BBF5C7
MRRIINTFYRIVCLIILFGAFNNAAFSQTYTETYTNGAFEVDIRVDHPCDGLDNGVIYIDIVSTTNGIDAEVIQIAETGGSGPSEFGVTIAQGNTYVFGDDENLIAGNYAFTLRDDGGVVIATFQASVDEIDLDDVPAISITATGNTQDNSTCQLPPAGPDGQVEVIITGGSLNLAGGGSLSYTWDSDNGLAGLPLTINNVTATTSLTVDLQTDLGVSGLPGGQYSITVNDDFSVCNAVLADATIDLDDPSPNTYSIDNAGVRSICDGTGTDIVLLGSDPPNLPEPNVDYTIWIDRGGSNNPTACADCVETGTGGNLTFSLTSADIQDGDIITIVATQGSCTPQVMTGSVEIDLLSLPTANDQTPELCEDTFGGGTVAGVN